ncbi:MAX gene-associated protein-like protein [Lates japonicus]|uniref:MAX gene-associated protein-like protein n=1 Tax=Lates japonicus TaxID=270547 RepID=A0AAD3NGW5_LATJO|nr:MAX gene-associated protein-like protein [Lates japonicus]
MKLCLSCLWSGMFQMTMRSWPTGAVCVKAQEKGKRSSLTLFPVIPPKQPTLLSCVRSVPERLKTNKMWEIPPTAEPRDGRGLRRQRGTCTFKILPSDSRKEPIIITCPKLPPQAPTKVVPALSSFALLQPRPRSSVTPVNLISLKPSGGRGAELGVKTVAVSAVPVGPGRALVLKPAPPQTSSSQTPVEKTHRATPPPPPPLGSEVTSVPPPRPPAEPEPARDLVDLDIICVDDDTELVTTEMQPTEVVDLVESSSGETENSSDFGDESGSEEEKEVKPNHRHNALERRRRIRIQQLFDGLRRRGVGLTEEKASKISTLKKAVQRRRRNRARLWRCDENSRQNQRRKRTMSLTEFPSQARQQIQTLQIEMASLKSLKIVLNQ